jgi:hypothetical protein
MPDQTKWVAITFVPWAMVPDGDNNIPHAQAIHPPVTGLLIDETADMYVIGKHVRIQHNWFKAEQQGRLVIHENKIVFYNKRHILKVELLEEEEVKEGFYPYGEDDE